MNSLTFEAYAAYDASASKRNIRFMATKSAVFRSKWNRTRSFKNEAGFSLMHGNVSINQMRVVGGGGNPFLHHDWLEFAQIRLFVAKAVR